MPTTATHFPVQKGFACAIPSDTTTSAPINHENCKKNVIFSKLNYENDYLRFKNLQDLPILQDLSIGKQSLTMTVSSLSPQRL